MHSLMRAYALAYIGKMMRAYALAGIGKMMRAYALALFGIMERAYALMVPHALCLVHGVTLHYDAYYVIVVW